jgi:hypothetical protein
LRRGLDFDPDVAILALREARRQLADGFDETAFRTWFREFGAMRFFSRAVSGEDAARMLADQMVEAYVAWQGRELR